MEHHHSNEPQEAHGFRFNWVDRISMSIVAGLLAVWSGLFFSNAGVLVGGRMVEQAGDEVLVCHYFTAAFVIEQADAQSRDSARSKAACPRLIRV